MTRADALRAIPADLWRLAGPANAKRRAQLLAVLTGRPKVPQAQAGVFALREELFRQFNIPAGCGAAREQALAAAIQKEICQ